MINYRPASAWIIEPSRLLDSWFNDNGEIYMVNRPINDELDARLDQEHVCVVRIRTTMWADKRGIHKKKSLSYLWRQCKGFNILEEDSINAGVDLIFNRITNIDECEDGAYQILMCDESRDFETGHIDDYCYKLWPFARDSGNVN